MDSEKMINTSEDKVNQLKEEIAIEKIKELEMQISDLTLRVYMLENLNSDILADFNDLKEQFGLIELGKSIT